MSNNRINKVLIANRGEIALRIERACDKLGIKSAITISDADKNSYFARKAKEIALIGGSSAKESYLDISKIIKAAKDTGCDAVHPGYGFLSENADFARAVVEAGLTFIGPRAECIETLGSKTMAREKVTKAGVPCTPGSGAGLSDKELVKIAAKIKYPVIIKAVAGGGGRGMRIAANDKELLGALPQARSEALKNFSDEKVFIEKYIDKPRHVEVQIFGDNFGNVVHFGTRECSAQRRHQKLVEEAPAPNLKPALREKLHKAAVKAGKSVNYNNAGTAEFLVLGDKFYFLEINTRIQVEHPVTEEVTGFDLVELQLKVAMNQKFDFKQKDIKFSKHAIEYRIYAEDAESDFMPSIGKITDFKRPKEEKYIREEIAFEKGDSVTPFYDAMLSKLIIIGEDRGDAIRKSKNALRQYDVSGIKINAEFHRWLLNQKEFLNSTMDIGYIGREFKKESLRELKAREILDPRHKAIDGAEYVEYIRYSSRKFKTEYLVEIKNAADGTFIFIPHIELGDRPKANACRRSNSFDAGYKALVEEVLEREKESWIFGG